MALLYPWATKEYLLWHMSLGQIIMYHNLGIEIRYGTGDQDPGSLKNKSASELRKMRDEVRAQQEAERKAKEQAESDKRKRETYGTRYGAV